ncbi:MAG TPA: lytic transglycosylase domain-containing protein, partial [Thermoanaerobaculia bacterium]|nr:lytic transglycosylase domain-containing protein [Thermoanaerobaculia bacterium]
MLRGKRLRLISIVVAIAAVIGGSLWFVLRPSARSLREEKHEEAPRKTEAPPDLEKLRNTFTAGVEAIRKNDGAAAVQQFSSFSFGSRHVEQYRLYYLARGHELAKNATAERVTLASLRAKNPTLVVWPDAAAKLANLYANAGDWPRAANTAVSVAVNGDTAPDAAAVARWQAFESRLYDGDLSGALVAAREVVVKNPASPQAVTALAAIRSIEGLPADGAIQLTAEERLERAVSLLRDGNAGQALGELDALAPYAPKSLADPIALNRGLALFAQKRYEDAIKAFEPLTSGAYRYAVPALYHASKSYRILSSSINPIVIKTVVQKQQVGTTKVKRGKGKKARTITKPKFANVKKNIQLVDLAKKAKKEQYDRLATERLKDLLVLPIADPVRLEVLNTLAAMAEAKNQDPYLQELIPKIIALDPLADPALQHLWDKAWAAYARGDLAGAKPMFEFIRGTYRSPNVRRQSTYWYARTIERLGEKAQAVEIYKQLAAAPYDDVYALHAEQHGAPRQTLPGNPLNDTSRPDWSAIAEEKMPPELRLAYELTALSDMPDAQLELQKNQSAANQPFADALLTDLLHAAGNTLEMYKAIRRAFPQLATVEQDSVPRYFLRMYYPIKYEKSIRKYSEKYGTDPNLIMALCLQESYYNPRAKSRVGATGLMQLMPATGKEIAHKIHGVFASSDLQNPDTNIELGTYYFRQLVNLFGGNWQLAVASYNGGQGNVARWRRAAPSKPMD